MTGAAITVAAIAAVAALAWIARGRQARRSRPAPGPARVLFPFLGPKLSEPVLESALRLARSDSATLVAVYLAQVPLHLPLDCALPRQSGEALAVLEAIEQRAHRSGVAVDARVERGRSPRHALRETIAHERYDRIVVAATTNGGHDGFAADDTAWLLTHAPGEILVLRPESPPVPCAAAG